VIHHFAAKRAGPNCGRVLGASRGFRTRAPAARRAADRETCGRRAVAPEERERRPSPPVETLTLADVAAELNVGISIVRTLAREAAAGG